MRSISAAIPQKRAIGFDEMGDVYGYEPFVWYVWQQGNYAPADPAKLVD